MPGQDRFSEDEVQKILAKSLRLQDNSQEEMRAEQGLSIDELEQIAEEVGISPEFLHQAISTSKDQFEIKEATGFLGVPSGMEINRSIPGELNEEVMSVLTKKLRADTKKRGILESTRHSIYYLKESRPMTRRT